MPERARIAITGAVQGVGFRPFIYRLALEHGVCGWVSNSAQGVLIEAEAPRDQLAQFIAGIAAEKPPHAFIQTFHTDFLEPNGYETFEIRHSDDSGSKSAIVLPDLATCPECLKEIFDPTNRRYLYPFTNCTHCGPRFTIVQGLPYDRPSTTMRHFPMCDECRAEYENPLDRRFHAQPNACPTCGPQLALWNLDGDVLARRHEALLLAADALRSGQIVAVKGLGGFHLMVDARDGAAVARLRARKRREEKPLAVMYPTLEQVKAECEVSDLEESLLTSSEAPIVLLRARSAVIAPEIAPGNPYLGVMLPYTPLHHILMRELGFPIVATSGNLSGEPICTDEREALERIGDIADLFLVHNRPIARHVDDSIARVAAGRAMLIRRARGYAPLPVELDHDTETVIAAGAHLKNTAAIASGRQIFISQHIGDMDTPQAYEAFRAVLADFQQLYELEPKAIACDLHPDYRTTRFAESSGLPVTRVQHHYAHVLACMAENRLDAPVLGVSWDGTGYGTDGTIWGGEFLLAQAGGFERVAHLSTFRLPGGERAIHEPRRAALGLLHAVYGEDFPTDNPAVKTFTAGELKVVKTVLRKGVNAPVTSSAGRLFDAVAALIGLRQAVSFEGQAAMELEFVADGVKTDECYPFEVIDITNSSARFGCIIGVRPLVQGILDDVRRGGSMGAISAKFHNTLTDIIVAIARRVGEDRIVLTGGCFQNRRLLESSIERLRAAGFTPYWHQHIPTNDGGISYGQMIAVVKEQQPCV